MNNVLYQTLLKKQYGVMGVSVTPYLIKNIIPKQALNKPRACFSFTPLIFLDHTPYSLITYPLSFQNYNFFL